jgi:hypothetical protein
MGTNKVQKMAIKLKELIHQHGLPYLVPGKRSEKFQFF